MPGLLADRSGFSVICAIVAAVAFSINDVLVRLISDRLPLHEIGLLRAVVALFLTLAIIVPLEGGYRTLKTRRPVIHVIRGLCLVFANLAFFAGLAVLPIASVTAVFFVAPLLITAFSAIFLKEAVGIRRWTALAVGLSGVLLIVRPGSIEFQWEILLPIIAAVCYAALHTLTRNLGLAESASTMVFYIQITFVFVCSAMGVVVGDGRYADPGNPAIDFVFRRWIVPDGYSMLIASLSGITSVIGGYLITQAYRYGEAGMVAPFEYVALILAVFWGYAVWDEIPAPTAALGIALILGSGVFVALREAQFGVRPSSKRLSGRR